MIELSSGESREGFGAFGVPLNTGEPAMGLRTEFPNHLQGWQNYLVVFKLVEFSVESLNWYCF